MKKLIVVGLMAMSLVGCSSGGNTFACKTELESFESIISGKASTEIILKMDQGEKVTELKLVAYYEFETVEAYDEAVAAMEASIATEDDELWVAVVNKNSAKKSFTITRTLDYQKAGEEYLTERQAPNTKEELKEIFESDSVAYTCK